MFTQELLIHCSGLNKSHRTGANSKHAPIFVGPPISRIHVFNHENAEVGIHQCSLNVEQK